MTDSAPQQYALQARHHHTLVERMTVDLGLDEARYVLRPGRPSAAWILGHLAEETDMTLRALTGGPSRLPADFEARARVPHFGIEDPIQLDDLRGLWRSVSVPMCAALDASGPRELAAAPLVEVLPVFADTLRTRADFVRGHVFHLAWHLGQLGMLRAELGLAASGSS